MSITTTPKKSKETALMVVYQVLINIISRNGTHQYTTGVPNVLLKHK